MCFGLFFSSSLLSRRRCEEPKNIPSRQEEDGGVRETCDGYGFLGWIFFVVRVRMSGRLRLCLKSLFYHRNSVHVLTRKPSETGELHLSSSGKIEVLSAENKHATFVMTNCVKEIVTR